MSVLGYEMILVAQSWLNACNHLIHQEKLFYCLQKEKKKYRKLK